MNQAFKGWQARVITLFPDMWPGPLGFSLTGQALKRGTWSLDVRHLRDYAPLPHRSVDDTPAGGGAGMVLRADIVAAALDDSPLLGPVIYPSPRGVPVTQKMAQQWADGPAITLLCGRFEGVDQRVLDARGVKEVCVGDFVLTGGEIPAMSILDACVRLLPGVVGDPDSLRDESFHAGLLEYPHYTRPQIWEDRAIPEVLLSGHHANITKWRTEQATELTKQRRPELWGVHDTTTGETEQSGNKAGKSHAK